MLPGLLNSRFGLHVGAYRFVLCMAVVMAARVAHCAEVVTLRNGFAVTCTSREMAGAGTMRLYLPTSGTEAGNYMDVPLASIITIEATVEPVPPIATSATAAGSKTDLAELLQTAGSQHNVNVALLASVIKAESAGNAHAVSRVGARGLMQLMPATAAKLGVKDSFAPGDNVNGGSAYLDGLLTRYHNNIALAVAAYNAGPGAVDHYRGIPPFRETRVYVARVLREFNRLVVTQATSAVPATAAALPGRVSR
ncbi:MAG: lytic transglycosylase domain-containing protein [Janthinobacterium lividum]